MEMGLKLQPKTKRFSFKRETAFVRRCLPAETIQLTTHQRITRDETAVMSPSPSPSSKYPNYRPQTNHDKVISRVISPAIERLSCPICLETLTHRRAAVIAACRHAYCLVCIRRWSCLRRNCPLCNAEFDSWLYGIDSGSSRRFRTEKLPPLREGKPVISQPRDRGRITPRSTENLSFSNSRSRPLPWRRSFGRPGLVPAHVIFERKLRWRASVYSRCLQAIPTSSIISLEQNISSNDRAKERILQRMEPWIRRELQAILRDPDPSIVVHVASSLFFASLERKLGQHAGGRGAQNDEVSPLRQFLDEKTEMFWHELRCFAESSFNMETYDAVVEYKKVGLDAEDN